MNQSVHILSVVGEFCSKFIYDTTIMCIFIMCKLDIPLKTRIS